MSVRASNPEEQARLLLEMEGAGLSGEEWNTLLEGVGRGRALRSAPDIVYLRILAIADRAAEEPSIDQRAPEQIVGYDDTGLPA